MIFDTHRTHIAHMSDKQVQSKRKLPQSTFSSKRNRCNNEVLYHNIIIEKLKQYAASAKPTKNNVWMTLEIVLETLPMDILLKKNANVLQNSLTHVPMIPKAYEEKFMRECYLPEDQPCIMEEACECNFIDLQQSFVGVAFVGTDINIQHTGLCVLCLRKTTQMLFYRIVSGGLNSRNLLQMYGNLCGTAGEYHESVMLTVPPQGPVHCMPLPIVAHQRNRYEVHHENEHKILKQINVAYEDFH